MILELCCFEKFLNIYRSHNFRDALQPGANTDKGDFAENLIASGVQMWALDSASLTGFVSMEGSREYAIPVMAQ